MKKFTVPKICKSKSGWYVWFRYEGSHPIKLQKGINEIHDLDERFKKCELIVEAVHYKLKNGWIPDYSKNILQKKRLSDALDDAMIQIEGRLSKNTYDAYKSTVEFFKDALTALRFDRILAENFTRVHGKQCLEWIKNDRGWSNNSYNKNLKHIRAVYFEILEADQSNVNPFRDIKNLKVVKTVANVPPTDAEMVLICDELRAKNYGLYIYYMLVYNVGIRIEECRNLQIKHLDFSAKMIKLDAVITKTSKDRTVPMLGNLYELLKDYEGLDPELYVFGVWLMNGGRHSQRNWFLPNKFRVKEDTPNRQWNKLIKVGLGINVTMYSAKHKGADDKHEAGMTIQQICDIFGHSEKTMTERYMHSLKNLRMQEAMKVKMKVF